MLIPRLGGREGAGESVLDGDCITATGAVRWSASPLAESSLAASTPGTVFWCISPLTESSLGAPTPGAVSVWSIAWSALDGAPAGCCLIEGVGNSGGCPLKVLVLVLVFAFVCGVLIWELL